MAHQHAALRPCGHDLPHTRIHPRNMPRPHGLGAWLTCGNSFRCQHSITTESRRLNHVRLLRRWLHLCEQVGCCRHAPLHAETLRHSTGPQAKGSPYIGRLRPLTQWKNHRSCLESNTARLGRIPPASLYLLTGEQDELRKILSTSTALTPSSNDTWGRQPGGGFISSDRWNLSLLR